MAETAVEKKNNCSDCENYIEQLGPNGYCELYKHNIVSQEYICGRFKKKEKQNIPYDAGNSDTEKYDTNKESSYSLEHNHTVTEKMLFAMGILGCFIITFFILFFGAIVCNEFFRLYSLSLALRTTVSFAIMFIVIGLTILSVHLVKKYKFMQISEFIISVIIFLSICVHYSTIWIDLHSIVLSAISFLI